MKITWKPVLLLVPVTGLLAGCGAISFDATCSNGHCTGTAGPAVSLQPSASIPGVPSSSPPPLPAPAVTVTRTQYVNWQDCLPPDPSWLDLNALISNDQAMGELEGCLQIPQGNEQEFSSQLSASLDAGFASRLFSRQQGRTDWAGSENEIECPDGQVIYSLFQIYAQYGIAR